MSRKANKSKSGAWLKEVFKSNRRFIRSLPPWAQAEIKQNTERKLDEADIRRGRIDKKGK